MTVKQTITERFSHLAGPENEPVLIEVGALIKCQIIELSSVTGLPVRTISDDLLRHAIDAAVHGVMSSDSSPDSAVLDFYDVCKTMLMEGRYNG